MNIVYFLSKTFGELVLFIQKKLKEI